MDVFLKGAEHLVIAPPDGVVHGKRINANLDEIMDYLHECSFHKNVLLSCDGRIIVRNLKKAMCKLQKNTVIVCATWLTDARQADTARPAQNSSKASSSPAGLN